MKIIKLILKSFVKVLPFIFVTITFGALLVFSVIFAYYAGVTKGYQVASKQAEAVLNDIVSSAHYNDTDSLPTPTPRTIVINNTPQYTTPTWGGPELWEAVNKRRQELGVNPLNNQAELCTIASIRLNQILELGKLDAHEGFGSMPDDRPDLLWIFQKYDITEFLVSGAETSEEAVALWENTLGHKKLLTGGEYVWGCIYGQNGFGVAITAY